MLDLATRRGSLSLGAPTLLGIFAAVAVGSLVFGGGVRLLAAVTALGWLVAVTYRWPLVVAGLALLASGDFLKIIPANTLPALALGSSLSFNLLDVLVLVSLPFAVVRLAWRHERPIFTWPVLLVMGAAAASVAVSLILGDGSLNAGSNLFRGFFYYTMYFVLVAAIDTPRKLNGWITFVFGTVVVACGLQLVEALVGHRLGAGLGNAYMFTSAVGDKLSVGAEGSVLYLWNRAAGLSLLGLLLALGVVVETRPVRMRYVVLVGLTIVSFALAFVRQYFVYVAVGVLAVLAAQRTGRTRGIAIAVVVVGLLSVGLVAGSPLLEAAYGPSPVDTWLTRASTIVTYGDQGNHVGRVRMMATQWDSFVESPILGHGRSIGSYTGATSTDVGVSNILVQTGLLGLLAITVLWASFLVTALRTRRTSEGGAWHGYAVGLIGFWAAVVAGSLYGVNYFSASESVWVLVVALSVLDRLRALQAPAREVTRVSQLLP